MRSSSDPNLHEPPPWRQESSSRHYALPASAISPSAPPAGCGRRIRWAWMFLLLAVDCEASDAACQFRKPEHYLGVSSLWSVVCCQLFSHTHRAPHSELRSGCASESFRPSVLPAQDGIAQFSGSCPATPLLHHGSGNDLIARFGKTSSSFLHPFFTF